MNRNYLLFYLFLATSFRLAAQSGSLDATFGQGGKVTTNVGNGETFMNSVLIQPDGKIVTVGYTGPQEYQGKFCLIRYNSDGTLDNTFGVDGVVETTLGGTEDLAFSAALQPDGKILAAGRTWKGDGDFDFALVRYTAEGLRDLTFGQSGIVTTNFGDGDGDGYGDDDRASKVVLQPDGKIMLAGATAGPGTAWIPDMAFARYLPDGQLDGSFGQNGKVIIHIDEPGLQLAQYVNSMTLQPDGKVLASGFTEVLDQTTQAINRNFVAVRLDANGNLDNNFGIGGIVLPSIGRDDVASSIQVQSDGKILIFGRSSPTDEGFNDFALVRYHANGTPDAAFGNQGIVLTAFDNTYDFGLDMVIQKDGKILTSGFTVIQNGTTWDFAMARFKADGSIDMAFGNNGKVTTDFNNNLDWGAAMALDSKGSIVAVGHTITNTHTNVALARYVNDAALPVKLCAFEARLEETEIQLEWQTAMESNSDHFDVERSRDGKKWVSIGSLDAAVNSEKPQAYHFTDSKPLAGENLYRLKMIDLDGTYAYSGIQSVRFQTGNPSRVNVYPNPVTDKLHLVLSKGEVLRSVKFYDLNGFLVFQSEAGSSEIDLPNLKTGPYCLVLQMADGTRHSQRILVRR
nr:T9SS type A sorting domain-containing protein [uncultured Dyadobacter sp.]